MEPQNKGAIFKNVTDALRAAGPLYRQTILVYRFQSFTGGGTSGVSKTRNNLIFPVQAKVYQITAKDALNSGGFYLEGDIITDTESDILGVSNVPGAIVQADQAKYNGQMFQVQGMPSKVFAAGGRTYTKTHWRHIGGTN